MQAQLPDRTSHVLERSLAEAVPADYLGPVVLPGSGRTVWWTGRIAIGLRHDRRPAARLPPSEQWLQELLLADRYPGARTAARPGARG
jgi:hypothetical protein